MGETKLLVTEYKGFDTCFKFENGNVTELFIEKPNDINVNDIYVGRVSSVKNDIKACFVDIKENVKGFLPFSEICEGTLLNRVYDGCLKQGDLVAVQVVKDHIKSKDYGLSMKLTIPGIFSVLTYDDDKIHVSSKIDKLKAKDLKASICNSYNYGFVIRTNAIETDFSNVNKELHENNIILDNIVHTMKSRTLYSLLFKGKSSLYDRIASLKRDSYDEIITDSIRLHDELSSLSNIRLYTDEHLSLKALYSFDKAYELATSKKVNLRSGGYLIIEPTEALTVIDVNSGKFDKKVSKEDAIHFINMDACKEICRQLRLRNLSGIVIIDFINYNDTSKYEELISLMKSELRKDIVKACFVDITELGLMELTREKKYAPVHELIK